MADAEFHFSPNNHELTMLAHNVFFTLKDASSDNIESLIAACNQYLKDHDGVAFFAVGGLVPDLNRPVNDLNFDVALHVVFDSREDHDRYQVHPRHLQFIEEQKSNWETVRVFDSNVN